MTRQELHSQFAALGGETVPAETMDSYFNLAYPRFISEFVAWAPEHLASLIAYRYITLTSAKEYDYPSNTDGSPAIDALLEVVAYNTTLERMDGPSTKTKAYWLDRGKICLANVWPGVLRLKCVESMKMGQGYTEYFPINPAIGQVWALLALASYFISIGDIETAQVKNAQVAGIVNSLRQVTPVGRSW